MIIMISPVTQILLNDRVGVLDVGLHIPRCLQFPPLVFFRPSHGIDCSLAGLLATPCSADFVSHAPTRSHTSVFRCLRCATPRQFEMTSETLGVGRSATRFPSVD